MQRKASRLVPLILQSQLSGVQNTLWPTRWAMLLGVVRSGSISPAGTGPRAHEHPLRGLSDRCGGHHHLHEHRPLATGYSSRLGQRAACADV